MIFGHLEHDEYNHYHYHHSQPVSQPVCPACSSLNQTYKQASKGPDTHISACNRSTMADPAAAPKQKAPKKEKKAAPKEDSAPLELQPPPSFLQDRLDLFDRLKAKQDEEAAKKPREPIKITMPDGSVKEGTAWETTPGDIAKGISNSLYKRTVVARLDGNSEKLWDLDRPLEASCKLELLDFDDPTGRTVFWHSSAHVLGEACERRFGCSLCIGPPIDTGFYYEMALPYGGAVQNTDWKPLETIVSKIAKEKQKFERLVMTKEELLEMFKYNKYKVRGLRRDGMLRGPG